MSPALRLAAWVWLTCAVWGAADDPLSAPIATLAFSPDGANLVSNGNRSLAVRSGSDGSLQRQLDCDLPKINAVAFHPNRPILAVVGGTPGTGGELRLLDWPSGASQFRATNAADLLLGVSFNTEGSLLAAAGADSIARVWRVDDSMKEGREFLALTGHSGSVLALAFNPSGQELVTAGADGSLKVWSIPDGRLLRSLNRHTDRINAVHFRPNRTSVPAASSLCVSAGDDRTVRVWQPGIGRMVRIVRGHEGAVLALAFTPDGRSLFSAGREGIVRHLDPDSDQIRAAWPWHADWIYALAISPDGTRIATGDWSGRVRVAPIPGGNPSR